jgi:purine-binding chemotaxis protein CheW
LALPAERVEKDDSGAGLVNPDVLDGIVKGAEGKGTIKILNPQRLLRDDFARLGVSGTRTGGRASISAVVSKTAAPEQQEQMSLISFDLAQQEYALPLDRVREIIPLPDHVSQVPRAETPRCLAWMV